MKLHLFLHSIFCTYCIGGMINSRLLSDLLLLPRKGMQRHYIGQRLRFTQPSL